VLQNLMHLHNIPLGFLEKLQVLCYFGSAARAKGSDDLDLLITKRSDFSIEQCFGIL
jgi:hypothetical protein